MEILFRQTGSEEGCAPLCSLGIECCTVKHISFDSDRARVTRKSHYHTNFEAHIIERGYQTYEVGGDCIRVEAGQLLIIPPDTPHLAHGEGDQTAKHALSWRLSDTSPLSAWLADSPRYYLCDTPPEITEDLRCITLEREAHRGGKALLVAARLCGSTVALMRLLCGEAADRAPDSDLPPAGTDDRLLLAKQYVEDNLYRSISLGELAAYCYISERQLSRIFRQLEGVSVMDYVRSRRCARIEVLLADPSLSLCEISRLTGFGNEYHFNSYFKKYAGMTPGAYRRSVTSGASR